MLSFAVRFLCSYIVLIIYCSGLIYSIPRLFEYTTEIQTENLMVLDNSTESITYVVIKNKLHNNTIYQYTVHLSKWRHRWQRHEKVWSDIFLALKSLFQSILPLLMLSYFNIELIRSVHASSRFLKRYTSLYGQTLQQSSGRESSIIRYREVIVTRSVICLIGLFIICQVPASILNYIYMFYRNHRWLYICYDISNFLVLLNSAVSDCQCLFIFFWIGCLLRWISLFLRVSIGNFVEN